MEEGKAREIIEIRSDAIDWEEIARTIEENLESRSDLYSSLEQEKPYLPSYEDLFASEKVVPSDALSYSIWRASQADLSVDLQVIPSVRIPTSLPIVGRFVDYLRVQFHNLVVFYLNTLASKQATAYAHLALTLRLLAQEMAELREEMRERHPEPEEGARRKDARED